jgi:hypothetical protein
MQRRLTFKQIEDGYILKKVMNVKNLEINKVYLQVELDRFMNNPKIDVVIK